MGTSGLITSLIVASAVLLLAYLSACEAAFSSVNRVRLKNMAAGDKRAQLALRLSGEYDGASAAIQLLSALITILAASFAAAFAWQHYRGAGLAVSIAVVTAAVVMFGQIAPRSLARRNPERFAAFAAPLLSALCALLKPLCWLFGLCKRLTDKLFQAKADSAMTEEELITIVEEAQSEGGIDSHESELIRSAIEFNDIEVGNIVTPRVDIVAVERDASMAEIAETFRTNGYSRMPVYTETIDRIIGVIHEKDFYAEIYKGATSIEPIIKEVVWASMQMQISALLRLLQQKKMHMAVVVDEFGGTCGIVTLEDILEELVGDIWDEHDEVVEFFKKTGDGAYLIDCSADLEEMFELFGIARVDQNYPSSTVSGWVMQELGRIPAVGDSFAYANLLVTVTQSENRRVREIRVEVAEPLLPAETELARGA